MNAIGSLQRLCVFCASSNSIAPEYYAAAEEFGRLIGERRLTLVYGGGKIGLMGVVARAVQAAGGKVVAVIPGFLRRKELLYSAADEIVQTHDLRERQAVMAGRADAFVALPGGLGTVEELMEALTLKQLGQHHKPIVLLNTRGFFAPLEQLLAHLVMEGFLRQDLRQLYRLARTPTEVFELLQEHLTRMFPPRTGARL